MRSHLVTGRVRHRRSRPFVYELQHEVFYAALDLSELDELAGRLRFLGRNRRSLFTFRDDDHWLPPAGDLNSAVREHLARAGHDAAQWRITLVTSLRSFGYVFNPASFYLCRDETGALRVVVVEVHNTHLERRLYTLEPRRHGTVNVADMAKDHYVSPFIGMDSHYTVRVRDEADRLQIVIDETEDGQPLLQASLNLRRRPLTDGALLRMLVRYPMQAHRTIGLIHWHALRLWRRGARFHPHGATAR